MVPGSLAMFMAFESRPGPTSSKKIQSESREIWRGLSPKPTPGFAGQPDSAHEIHRNPIPNMGCCDQLVCLGHKMHKFQGPGSKGPKQIGNMLRTSTQW